MDKLIKTNVFTPTIEANDKFVVEKVGKNKHGEEILSVSDGKALLFVAKNKVDHNEELLENECYIIFERFIDDKGVQWLYTADTETGEDFLVHFYPNETAIGLTDDEDDE